MTPDQALRVTEFVEGKKAKTGEVRRWGDGHDYEKQGDGSWKKVAGKPGAKPSVQDPLAGAVAASVAKAKELRAAPPAPAPEKPKLKGPLNWVSSKSKWDDDEVQSAVKDGITGETYTLHVGKGWTPDGMSHTDKWRVTVFGPMSVTLVKQDGFASRADAEDFAKETALNAIHAKRTPAAPVAAKSADEVKTAMDGAKTQTGGRLTLQQAEPDFLSFEPKNRQRLDHYGNDGEGWDDEAWETDYAGPLRREVEALLKEKGLTGWMVDIGEKGHVELQKPRVTKESVMNKHKPSKSSKPSRPKWPQPFKSKSWTCPECGGGVRDDAEDPDPDCETCGGTGMPQKESLESLIDDARELIDENSVAPLPFADDPVSYNGKLAKLMQGLKKDKATGVAGVRQGYKGTGSKSYKRQIWCQMPSHDRGGPDVWLDNGFVKLGGVVGMPNSIPSARKYGEDPPEVVYNWIADTLKQLKNWIDAKYTQPPQSPQSQAQPESTMNADMNKKLEALRHELEEKLGLSEEGSTPQYKAGNVPAKNKMGVQDLDHAKPTGGSTPQYKGGNVPAKNAMGTQDVKVKGSQSKPPSKKVPDSVLPSKMESLPGFRRLAGLEDLRRIATEE